tara:strand:- start:42 stop:527 length:486 start_codon:yes stop_codon:yes gene_type:complete
MKIIIIIISLFFVSSCGQTKDDTFTLDPSKPIEVGIESIGGDSQEVQIINVYMINHQPVSGIQFKIEPDTFFNVDSVFGGRCQANDFQLHSNDKGTILGFSMSGASIPESKNLNKKDNILFSIKAKLKQEINAPITLSPIIASSSAKRIECISIPFELIGK